MMNNSSRKKTHFDIKSLANVGVWVPSSCLYHEYTQPKLCLKSGGHLICGKETSGPIFRAFLGVVLYARSPYRRVYTVGVIK